MGDVECGEGAGDSVADRLARSGEDGGCRRLERQPVQRVCVGGSGVDRWRGGAGSESASGGARSGLHVGAAVECAMKREALNRTAAGSVVLVGLLGLIASAPASATDLLIRDAKVHTITSQGT